MTIHRLRETRTAGGIEQRNLAGMNPSGYAYLDPSAIPPHGYDHLQRAGVLITPHTLLQADVVYTALRIISNNIITMRNLRAFKWGFDANSGHTYKKFLSNQPAILTNTFGGGNLGGLAGTMMQCTGMDRTIWSMALFNEAFWYVLTRDKLERPETIEVLHPAFMEVKVEESQVKFLYGSGADRKELNPWNVIQIPMKSLPAARRALAPTDYASIAGGLALAAYEFGSSWFSQGAAPSFILSTDQKLGQDEVDRIAQKFLIEHSGLQQAHLPLVLDSGIKADKIMSSPDEAQFLQSLDLAEPILTTSGWKTMGTVEVGDVVYAEDGSQTPISGVSPVFLDSPCYELTFADGSTIVASDDHRWHVWDNYAGQREGGYYGEWKTLVTSEIVADWKWYGGKNRYRVACDGVVDAPAVDLPIDPYLFGYWLGDGSSADTALTVGDDDRAYVEDAVRAAGCDVTSVTPLNGGWGRSWRVRLSGGGFTRDALRELGVFGVGNKHIPDVYLTANIEQRKALLAGLLDSDGSAGPRVRFTSTLPRLAADVLSLARSLGQRASATIRECPPREGVRTSKAQTIVSWTATFDPFGMPRKSAAVQLWEPAHCAKDVRKMSIVGVRRVESRSTRCIRVDHPSHVFLAGRTFVPTGNTLEYSRQVLANWFGLPPSWVPNALLREAPSPPHSRQEEMTTFKINTLSGYTVPLEEVMSALIPDEDVCATFDEHALERPDASFQAQLLQALRITQTASINDNRVRLMGWAPVEGGDEVNMPYASNVAPDSPSQTGSQSPKPPGKPGGQGDAADDEERAALTWLLKRISRHAAGVDE